MRLSCSTKPKTEEQDKKDKIRKWNSKQRRKKKESPDKKEEEWTEKPDLYEHACSFEHKVGSH
jgi:hypothetical protein